MTEESIPVLSFAATAALVPLILSDRKSHAEIRHSGYSGTWEDTVNKINSKAVLYSKW